MQLSTMSTYGLRALLDIALHSNGKPVSVREIALRQDISAFYLKQIILSLQMADFVRSIRGKGGGFVLAKLPSEIRLDDVLRSLERKLTLADCVDHPGICPKVKYCATREIWCRLTMVLTGELRAITLQGLMESQREKECQSDIEETGLLLATSSEGVGLASR